jgi:coiled-coil domain-containing protein 77
VFDERQRLLALQAENDQLRLQELQDRKSIQQLLALQQGPRPGQPSALAGPSLDHLLLQIESLNAQLSEQVRAGPAQPACFHTFRASSHS